MQAAHTPILLLGAGRLGGALLAGWSRAGAFHPADLIIVDPHPSEAAQAAAEAGAALNPPEADFARVRTVVLAVKPQYWRRAAEALAPHLPQEAVVVSVAAGLRLADLSEAFGGRPVARVMPTTAVAVARGAAAFFAADPRASEAAHAVFDPVAAVVELDREAMIDATIGVSGSAPGFVYAFVEALEAAGVAQGLSPQDAARLARASLAGAAALMTDTGADPADLRAQVTSPGGTTAAGLEVLMRPGGLGDLVAEAVDAAGRRSVELGEGR